MRYAVQWIVWSVLMALVMGWLARSRSRSRAASDAALLYHPTSTLIVGLVVGGLFARIQYSQSAKWFRLITNNGEVVRVSVMLVGLPEFARAVLDEVPPEKIDTGSKSVLEQTAAGHPPSLWM